jgi:hypothetical protein
MPECVNYDPVAIDGALNNFKVVDTAFSRLQTTCAVHGKSAISAVDCGRKKPLVQHLCCQMKNKLLWCGEWTNTRIPTKTLLLSSTLGRRILKLPVFYSQGDKGVGKEKLPKNNGLTQEQSSWSRAVKGNTWNLAFVYRVVFGSCLLATNTLRGFVIAGTFYKTKNPVTICLKKNQWSVKPCLVQEL